MTIKGEMRGDVLVGRRAVVTGGARGIGLGVARLLLERGARVILADVDQDALAAAGDALSDFDNEHIAVCCCDITEKDGLMQLKEHVQRLFKGLDVLINNAAILDWTAIDELTEERLQQVLKVNLFGAIACIQGLLPMLCQSAYPRIVNISSVNGLRGTSQSSAYNASKAALISLTQSLAIELAPRGIGINVVAPGFVATRMSKLPDGSSEYSTEWFKDVYLKHRRLPIGRPATPEDVAGPVAFLCSDDARYINGHVLVVDGGLTATL
jgi:NAD(P)-dependent dehydrogenase (short-subunit alcohol dehydrogenase family)